MTFSSNVVAATGHRPQKLGGFSEEAENSLVDIATTGLAMLQPGLVITGMALGWDMAVARAARSLGIRYVCAIPFKGQESIWPQNRKDMYRELLGSAYKSFVLSEGGFSGKSMQLRNQWMVDNCTLLMAMWDGSTGGTHNCVKYALSVGRPLVNLYPLYEQKENSHSKSDKYPVEQYRLPSSQENLLAEIGSL